MRHLVIGLGEVGSALQKVLECDGFDPKTSPIVLSPGSWDVVHICFPYSENFISEVKRYQLGIDPKHTVIHSTVPIGTSAKLCAVYSPVRGVHPYMEAGLRTFKKFIGGMGEEAKIVAEELKRWGIRVEVHEHSTNLEAAKLWDTTQYGVMILLEKEITAFCVKNGLTPRVVYKLFNETYNEGYEALGRPEVVRPYLKHKPGKIGGHCVVQNAALLDSPSAHRIISENDKL